MCIVRRQYRTFWNAIKKYEKVVCSLCIWWTGNQGRFLQFIPNIVLNQIKCYNVQFKWFIIVFYPGFQIALNSRININKIGSVEKMLNRYVVYFFVITLVLIILFTLLTVTQGYNSSSNSKACNRTISILDGDMAGFYNSSNCNLLSCQNSLFYSNF